MVNRWRERRLERRLGHLTGDCCEACGRRLRAKERVEVFEPAPMGHYGEAGFGGGGIAAFYCPDHAETYWDC